MGKVAADAPAVSGAGVQVVEGWSLVVDGAEPMVRDVELGERLGFGRPRDFRKLIERLVAEGAILESDLARHGVASSSGHGGHRKPVTEYHLTRKGALLAISKSRTPKANEITRQMVDVFDAYLRGALQPSRCCPEHQAQRQQLSPRLKVIDHLFVARQAAELAQRDEPRPRQGLVFGALARLLWDIRQTLYRGADSTAESFTAMSELLVEHRSGPPRLPSPQLPPQLPGPLDGFLASLRWDPAARTPVRELRGRYEAWCAGTGAYPVTPRALAKALRDRGARSVSVRAEGKVQEGWAGVA